MRFRPRSIYDVFATLALFLVLGGTALAVDGSLPGQNTVGSADIINGEVQADDLKAESIGSGKLADRQVKNADLGLGASSSNTIADGGIEGIDVKNDTLNGNDIDEGALGMVPSAGDAFSLNGKGLLEVAPIRIYQLPTIAGSPFVNVGNGLHYIAFCGANHMQLRFHPDTPAALNVMSTASGVDGSIGGNAIPNGAQDVRLETDTSTGSDAASVFLSDTSGSATAALQVLINTNVRTYRLDLHLHHVQGADPDCEVFGTVQAATIM